MRFLLDTKTALKCSFELRKKSRETGLFHVLLKRRDEQFTVPLQ